MRRKNKKRKKKRRRRKRIKRRRRRRKQKNNNRKNWKNKNNRKGIRRKTFTQLQRSDGSCSGYTWLFFVRRRQRQWSRKRRRRRLFSFTFWYISIFKNIKKIHTFSEMSLALTTLKLVVKINTYSISLLAWLIRFGDMRFNWRRLLIWKYFAIFFPNAHIRLVANFLI